ncbi:MAG: putative spermidine/putrescine transport system ATP-binding protein, partial [Paracoccaceae bacterium]
PGPDDNRIEARLIDVMHLGSKTMLHCAAQGNDRVMVELSGLRPGFVRGGDVTLGWSVENTLIHEAPA